jgi:hypothetical protein
MDRQIATPKAFCPQCRQAMTNMGSYFEAPKLSDRKMWAVMRELAEAGYRFRSEGSRAWFIGRKSGLRSPSTRTVMSRIQAWLVEHKSSTSA